MAKPPLHNFKPRERQVKTVRLPVAVAGSAFLAAICIANSGCSDAQPKRVPVSGTVLIDGKPLTLGTIRFVPEHGRPASSAILGDGSFDLAATSASSAGTKNEIHTGIAPGVHQIEVSASEVIDEETIRWYVPKKYANFRTSGLKQSIDKANNNLTIELSWSGQEGPFVEEQGNEGKNNIEELTAAENSEETEDREDTSAEAPDTNDTP